MLQGWIPLQQPTRNATPLNSTAEHRNLGPEANRRTPALGLRICTIGFLALITSTLLLRSHNNNGLGEYFFLGGDQRISIDDEEWHAIFGDPPVVEFTPDSGNLCTIRYDAEMTSILPLYIVDLGSRRHVGAELIPSQELERVLADIRKDPDAADALRSILRDHISWHNNAFDRRMDVDLATTLLVDGKRYSSTETDLLGFMLQTLQLLSGLTTALGLVYLLFRRFQSRVRRHRILAGRCSNCGYSIEGLTSIDACPECGICLYKPSEEHAYGPDRMDGAPGLGSIDVNAARQGPRE